jgi:hypothetical protein
MAKRYARYQSRPQTPAMRTLRPYGGSIGSLSQPVRSLSL